MIRPSYVSSLSVGMILHLVVLAAQAGNMDVVEFGGSRMVGEVKRLERGKLYFKTEATDTIEIDWAEVTTLVTAQHMRIEHRDGRISFGSFASGARAHHLSLMNTVTEERPRSDVVAFSPIEATFWQRLDVDTSIGYSFAKSTGVEQIDVSAELTYDAERHSRRLSLSGQSSKSEGGDRSVRRTIDYASFRLQRSPYLWGWIGQYQDNEALGLDHRVLGALVWGRDFYPLVNQRLRGFTGIAVSEEVFAGAEAQTSSELLIGGRVDWYRFRSPELDLSSELIIYPSTTDLGRWRSQVEITLRWELIEDLFWELSFYDDYDSRTTSDDGSDGPSVNDYGVTTGLGWSW